MEESNRKYTMAKYLNSDNTTRMFNYLVNEKKNRLFLEYSMFNSYIDNLEKKLNNSNNNSNVSNDINANAN